MEKFIKENAIGSCIVNLIMNTAVPSLLLWNEKVVFLKDGEPNLLPNMIGPVVVSAFLTTIGTFFLLTIKRKSGEVNLPINANTKWFPKALLTGIIIAIGFGLLAFIQKGMDNTAIPKSTVIIISAIIGTLTGLPTSFIAAKRASNLK
jgi:RsiW-degrading membrane proteinase PrsW (M82 family)